MQYEEVFERKQFVRDVAIPEDPSLHQEWILQWIGRGQRVLDVGCGSGALAQRIMEQNNDVWAIEPREELARVAVARGLRLKIGGSEDSFPFPNKDFDIVHSSESLEQVYDTRAFFEEVVRVLKPGGRFLFTVSNLNSLENRLKVLTGGYLSQMGLYPEDHHGTYIRIFNTSKLSELCKLSGLEVARVRGVPFLKPVPRWLKTPAWIVGTGLPQWAPALLVEARKGA